MNFLKRVLLASAASWALALSANAQNLPSPNFKGLTLSGVSSGLLYGNGSSPVTSIAPGAGVAAALANPIGQSGGIGPVVANNTQLSALASTYAGSVTRLGFAAAGDAPPVVYASSNSACSLNAGAGDGGSQVPSSDGKCWLGKIVQAADVRIWGVDMTGATDSTTTLQNAFTYGGQLTAPAGTITVGTTGSPVVCGTKSLEFSGAGFGSSATIIKTASATVDMFQATVSNCNLNHMILENKTGVTRTAGAFYNCIGANYCSINDFEMDGWYYGLENSGATSTFWRVNNGNIQLPAGTSSVGIYATSSTAYGIIDGVIDNTVISYGGGLQPLYCVYVNNVGDLTLDHVSTIGCQEGLYVAPGSGQGIQALFVTNSLFDSARDNGIDINAISTGVVQLVKISNSWAASATNNSMIVQTMTGGTVEEVDLINIHAVNSGASGLIIGGAGVTHVNVDDGCYANNTSYGVYVLSGATYFNISNATIAACGAFPSNGNNAIYLTGSNATINIHDNIFCGSLHGTINIAGSLDTTSRIENNLCYNIGANSGPLTVGASPATICAGPSPETHYFTQSATNTATIKLTNTSGPLVGTMSSATIPVVVSLGPNECEFVTWTTTAPTYAKSIH